MSSADQVTGYRNVAGYRNKYPYLTRPPESSISKTSISRNICWKNNIYIYHWSIFCRYNISLSLACYFLSVRSYTESNVKRFNIWNISVCLLLGDNMFLLEPYDSHQHNETCSKSLHTALQYRFRTYFSRSRIAEFQTSSNHRDDWFYLQVTVFMFTFILAILVLYSYML